MKGVGDHSKQFPQCSAFLSPLQYFFRIIEKASDSWDNKDYATENTI